MNKKCTNCHKEKEEYNFYKESEHCKFCVWINKIDLTKLPINWTMEDVILILEYIYEGKIKYLNELTKVVPKTLNDIIELISNILKLSNIGNKRLRIIVNCENCGKEKETFMCKIKDSNFQFCSHSCYSEFRSKYYVKEKASVYNSTEVECDYCHTLFLVPENKLKVKNKEGKTHHFCSHEHYSEFRKKYYVGDKLYNTGKKMSKEFIEQCRINTTKCYAEGKITRKTKPQLFTNQILDELEVKYLNEKQFKYYSVDNYLEDYNLIIEVMGDYFHANPLRYEYSKLNKMQLKDIVRDARKHTYIKRYYNVNILYLWENDINKNIEKCKKLIMHYIEHNGDISDYNSFNYKLIENKLTLNKNIISPFYIKESVTSK